MHVVVVQDAYVSINALNTFQPPTALQRAFQLQLFGTQFIMSENFFSAQLRAKLKAII